MVQMRLRIHVVCLTCTIVVCSNRGKYNLADLLNAKFQDSWVLFLFQLDGFGPTLSQISKTAFSHDEAHMMVFLIFEI